MAQDRPVLGILLMLGFCILAPMGDALAKIASQTVPLGQLLWARFAIQALVLIPLVWLTGRLWRSSLRIFGFTLLRTVLHVIGIGAMVSALRFLPLADAIAIAFVMPFIQLLLGRYVLGEVVGQRRLWACVVGFVGTLFVVQPSFAAVGWPALLPLFVALTFSVFMLITRHIAKDTDPVGLQAVSGVVAVVLITPILWAGTGTNIPLLKIVTPTAGEMTLLLGIGLLGTGAHLLMTWSLRYAPSATVAPMQYLEIPFATLIGFVVFTDFPNGLASLGIVITVAAGLYVIWRERATARLRAPNPA